MSATYDSDLDLSLGQVPDVSDPALYQELLDIHNALEQIASALTALTVRVSALDGN